MIFIRLYSTFKPLQVPSELFSIHFLFQCIKTLFTRKTPFVFLIKLYFQFLPPKNRFLFQIFELIPSTYLHVPDCQFSAYCSQVVFLFKLSYLYHLNGICIITTSSLLLVLRISLPIYICELSWRLLEYYFCFISSS